jgi:hypothetical protein
MCQMIRRFLTATGVALALLLAVPGPSWAGQVRKPAPEIGLVARAWSWLESLLGGQPEVRRKTVMGTSQPSPVPLPQPPYEGPMIDPDGAR